MDVSNLRDECRIERQRFMGIGDLHSPACARLFQFASQGSYEAWSALHEVLWPECLSWFETWTRNFSWMEPEELAQDVWLKLQTAPPNQPTNGNDISPAMAYLRTCSMRRFLMEKRKYKHRTAVSEISIEQPVQRNDNQIPFEEVLTSEVDGSQDFAEGVDLRLAIQTLLNSLLNDCQKIVVRDVFVLKKPRTQIASENPSCFDDVGQVFEMTRLVKSKLAANTEFQSLVGHKSTKRGSKSQKAEISASLYTNFEHTDVGGKGNNDDMSKQEHCAIAEADLLDYVQGHAPPLLAQQIEASPICVEAAQQMLTELQQWLPTLRNSVCPSEDELVSYFENRLSAGQRLVVGRHIQECAHCREELALLVEMSDVFRHQPQFGLGHLIRRTVQAFFISETQRVNALRGPMVQFQTDSLFITLDRQRSDGKASLWTLSGEVRTKQGQLVTTLQEVEVVGQEESNILIGGNSEIFQEDGQFFVTNLETGIYKLHLRTADEDIYFDHSLNIGETFQVV